MKHLALTFALLWWAQGAVCLIPGLAHSHGEAAVVSGAEHVDHAMHAHHGVSVPEQESAPTQDGDDGCEQHCASLAQAISPTATITPAVAAIWLPLVLAAAPRAIQHVAARTLDSHHNPPPPDFVIHHASLLI